MARTCQFAKMRKKPKYKIRVHNRCRICGRPQRRHRLRTRILYFDFLRILAN